MGSVADELMRGWLREKLGGAFEQSAAEAGYELLVDGADRHGSFIWEAGLRREGFSRSITVSVTPEHDATLVESWAAATDGVQFTRRKVTSRRLGEEQFFAFAQRHGLGAIVVGAASMAQSLSPDDLDEAYAFSAIAPSV